MPGHDGMGVFGCINLTNAGCDTCHAADSISVGNDVHAHLQIRHFCEAAHGYLSDPLLCQRLQRIRLRRHQAL